VCAHSMVGYPPKRPVALVPELVKAREVGTAVIIRMGSGGHGVEVGHFLDGGVGLGLGLGGRWVGHAAKGYPLPMTPLTTPRLNRLADPGELGIGARGL
jgi:hypothetical protein